MACVVVSNIVVAYLANPTAYVVMAYVGMAYTVMADVDVIYIVMAYVANRGGAGV